MVLSVRAQGTLAWAFARLDRGHLSSIGYLMTGPTERSSTPAPKLSNRAAIPALALNKLPFVVTLLLEVCRNSTLVADHVLCLLLGLPLSALDHASKVRVLALVALEEETLEQTVLLKLSVEVVFRVLHIFILG